MPEDVKFWPSRRKQLVVAACAAAVAFLCAVGLVLVIPLDAARIEDETLRSLVREWWGWSLFILGSVFLCALIMAILPPIMLVVDRAPALTLNPEGMEFSMVEKMALRWEEIDSLLEYVPTNLPWPMRRPMLGIMLRDENAVRERVGWQVRGAMDRAVQQGWPPLSIMADSAGGIDEMLDKIEKYLQELKRMDPRRSLPKVHRE